MLLARKVPENHGYKSCQTVESGPFSLCEETALKNRSEAGSSLESQPAILQSLSNYSSRRNVNLSTTKFVGALCASALFGSAVVGTLLSWRASGLRSSGLS